MIKVKTMTCKHLLGNKDCKIYLLNKGLTTRKQQVSDKARKQELCMEKTQSGVLNLDSINFEIVCDIVHI